MSWQKNPTEWLSNTDISRVMDQYTRRYKCFEFIGPAPIDFDTKITTTNCVWPELCNFNLNKQIERGKTKIGIIFNTDPHDKGGEHWVSLFINLKKLQIFYFDSVGTKVPSQILDFVKRIQEQGRNMDPPIILTFDQNYPVEHQYGNTECGMYSLFFITHMLEDKITSTYLKTHILKDKYMQKFRKIFFNESL
jgi:hypothetical protein